MCVCVCAYGVTRVRITRVWLLCGTEINSCRCGKWHDNQSPPHRHLPPLCQFVSAYPSVSMPSFNIEQEHETRRKEKERKERIRATDKERSPQGEQGERLTGVYQRAKTRNVLRGASQCAQVRNTPASSWILKLGLTRLLSFCQCFSSKHRNSKDLNLKA